MANPNPNLKNLSPPFSKNDPIRARECGKKGAEKTNKIIKKKKELKERLKLLCEILTEKESKKEKDKLKSKIIKQVGYDVYKFGKLLTKNFIKEADQLKALNSLWDRIDGKPIQRIEPLGDLGNININVSFKDNNKTKDKKE